MLHVEHGFLHCDVETSPKKKVGILESEQNHVIEEVCRLYPTIEKNDDTEHPNWIKIQNSIMLVFSFYYNMI